MLKDDLRKAQLVIVGLRATIKELRKALKVERKALRQTMEDLCYAESIIEDMRSPKKRSVLSSSEGNITRSEVEKVAESIDKMARYAEKHNIDLGTGIIDIDEN